MKTIKLIIILLLLFSAQSCSFIVDVVLYNNSNSKIKVCNLNLKETKCVLVSAKSMVNIPLIGDIQKNEWGWIIQKESEVHEYWFSFEVHPEHSSNKYCTGVIQKKCDIPLQLEEDGSLYWAGKDTELPTREFPKQPHGFPINPKKNK
jgi:hypothetical protein